MFLSAVLAISVELKTVIFYVKAIFGFHQFTKLTEGTIGYCDDIMATHTNGMVHVFITAIFISGLIVLNQAGFQYDPFLRQFLTDSIYGRQAYLLIAFLHEQINLICRFRCRIP